uniref:HDOD domain-containing protein n=2 Tax=unclassified Pseudomonas TaxID=196821 RepID=UPI002637C3F2
GLRVVDTENRLLNTNHAVVGYFTAKSWNLPLHLCEAIASHHDALAIFSDDSGRDAQLKTLLAILKMAEHICESHRVLGGQAADHEWQSIEQLVLEYVGLSESDFEYLRESIRELGEA